MALERSPTAKPISCRERAASRLPGTTPTTRQGALMVADIDRVVERRARRPVCPGGRPSLPRSRDFPKLLANCPWSDDTDSFRARDLAIRLSEC